MPTSPDRASQLLGAMEAVEHEPVDHRRGRRHAQGLFTLPVALRNARLRVGPSALIGAVVLLVAVLAVVGMRVAWAQRSAEPTPVPRSDSAVMTRAEHEPTPPTAGANGAETAPVAPTTASGPLYVHVIGAVQRTGVVGVPPGSRVGDVVEAAGGLSASADPSRLNLARTVLDGERIWVPVEGAEPPEEVPVPAAVETGSATGQAPTGESGAPVDLNTADSTSLQTLPGVGPVTAEAILAWRAEHGRFSTAEELVEVSGIGPRTLERLRSLVTVSP